MFGEWADGSAAATVNRIVNSQTLSDLCVKAHSPTRSAAASSSGSPAARPRSARRPRLRRLEAGDLEALKVLEESGVVTRVVDGRTHRLSLDPAALDGAVDWMQVQRRRWSALFDAVDEYLKEEPK